MPSPTSIALIVAAVLFVAFLVAKLGFIDRRGAMAPEVRKRIRELVAAARRERTDTAWVAAGRALLDAGRPSRGAALAWRALGAKPSSGDAVTLLNDSWIAMKKPQRLERALWKVLDKTRSAPEDTPSRAAARRFLLALYEGPLHAPAKADELRRAIKSGDAPPSA